jgi:transposase-like protein
MPPTKPPYPPEFRREAVQLVRTTDKPIAITVAEESAMLSPQEAAERLGFSRQHVRRLIEAGELEGRAAAEFNSLEDSVALGPGLRAATRRSPRTRSEMVA